MRVCCMLTWIYLTNIIFNIRFVLFGCFLFLQICLVSSSKFVLFMFGIYRSRTDWQHPNGMIYSNTFVIKNITFFINSKFNINWNRDLGVYAFSGSLVLSFRYFFFCLTKVENDTAISYDALLGAMLNNKKFKRYLHIKYILDSICTFFKSQIKMVAQIQWFHLG